jgi:hypothetical protein
MSTMLESGYEPDWRLSGRGLERLLEAVSPQPEAVACGRPDPRILCLEHWLARLPADARALIVDYYGDDRGRRVRQRQAEGLEITYVSLRSRAHRIRRQLEAGFRQCARSRVCRCQEDMLGDDF